MQSLKDLLYSLQANVNVPAMATRLHGSANVFSMASQTDWTANVFAMAIVIHIEQHSSL